MRLCHLFALVVGVSALIGVAPPSAEACHWWGRGHGGWGGGGPRYVAPAPGYYAPAPGYYAPPPGYAAPRTYYASPPGPYLAPGTITPMPAAPARPTTAATVAAKDNAFDPTTLNVQPGATVRWTNAGHHPHTVTDRGGKFDSGDIPPGGTYSMTFQTPGTYRYYCKHHKGMEGTIVVGEPGKGPATGPSPAKGSGY